MGKKVETYAVVEAGLEKPREILYDVICNSADDDPDPETLEGAQKHLEEIRTKDEHHKIVKVTIEEITTLDDAVAYRVG